MSYVVKLKPSAQKELDAIPQLDYSSIAKTISSLAKDPRPLKVKKLADSGLWRIRVRDYRVVYTINDVDKTVIIVRVARRKEDTYKRI
jgi:mRNA interferase RelE/StbE